MAETGGGSVVNISSLAGVEPWPAFSAYGTAKAALNFLTQEMAQDFAPVIRVNAIACGSIETDALATVLTEDIRRRMIEMTPMARIGQVEDIAACAVYLASDAADFVTGQIVGVHGGTNGLNMDMPRTKF
jgi:7-alpha-hydroxysteroid dehydrogenase